MKKLVLFSILLSSTSFAQSSRDLAVVMQMNDSGEQGNALLQVNAGLTRTCHGDMDMPRQGYCDYAVTGTVVMDGKSCDFSVVRTQTDLKHEVNDPALRNRRDRSGTISLCSDLSLEVNSVEGLLSSDVVSAKLMKNGLVVGNAVIAVPATK